MMSSLNLLRRSLSTTTTTTSTSPSLTPKQKALTALSLLKAETDPDRILSICRQFSLSPPSSHLALSALSLALSSLSSSPSSSPSIRSLLSPLPPHQSILLFGHAHMLPDALRTFQSSPPSTRTLNALLFASILSQNHHQVPILFRDLPTSRHIAPDLTTYNTLLRSFAESGSSLSFYSVLDEMLRKKINPNLTTFSIAIAGFYREELFDHVERVLRLMKKHGRPAGLSIYNVRIQSLCKLGRATEAKQLLFKEMKSRRMKPNSVTYGHLILGFCNLGDLEEAKRLFKEMGRRGYVPESSCYFTLIHYLCRGGEFETALEVCRESMERNWVPCFSTMKHLVDGLVSMKKIDEAREIVGKVKERFKGGAEKWKEVEQGLPSS